MMHNLKSMWKTYVWKEATGLGTLQKIQITMEFTHLIVLCWTFFCRQQLSLQLEVLISCILELDACFLLVSPPQSLSCLIWQGKFACSFLFPKQFTAVGHHLLYSCFVILSLALEGDHHWPCSTLLIGHNYTCSTVSSFYLPFSLQWSFITLEVMMRNVAFLPPFSALVSFLVS